MRKILCTIFYLIATASLLAHAAPESVIKFRIQSDLVSAQISIPLSELSLAFHDDLVSAELSQSNLERLKSYLQDRIHARSSNGEKWDVRVDHLSTRMSNVPNNHDAGHSHHSDQTYELVAEISMIPPEESETDRFDFEYTVVHHEVMSHRTRLLQVRDNFSDTETRYLGLIRSTKTSISVDLRERQ